MKVLALTLINIFFITFTLNISFAQQGSQVPAAQPPWFFYWPSEDANNFENSTLSPSTLDRSDVQRRSNVDVNKPREEREQTTQRAPQQITQPESVHQPSANPVYSWTDDNGQTHFTNNPDNIPQKYRDQAVKK